MIAIRPYEGADAGIVVDLVLGIQRDEFGIDITAADQPDLLDVPTFYRRGDGNFWVAIANGEIVGTIGLLDIGNNQGALRKMFVRPAWRGGGKGVASRLMACLMDWAAAHSIGQVYLGTTQLFKAAHRFYARQGFVEIGRESLPAAFPVMALDTRFFARDLSKLVQGAVQG